MSKYAAVVATLVLGAVSAHASAATPDVETVCAATACRDGGTQLVLRLDKENYTTISVNRSPYILEDGSILVFPGETFAIQYDIENGQPVRPRFVRRYAPAWPMQIEENDNVATNPADAGLPALPTGGDLLVTLPPNTVVISYGQPQGEVGMLMRIEQSMPKRLKYAATMHVLGKDGYDAHPTSTCPIISRGSIFESWPHPIGPMILKSPRLMAEGDSWMCE